MNVLSRTPDGDAIVRAGSGLGDTARPHHRLILKEVNGPLEDGALYLFSNKHGGRIYRRVCWTGSDTVKLVPEYDHGPGTIRLQWPEDKGEWEVLARVDRVLKPL